MAYFLGKIKDFDLNALCELLEGNWILEGDCHLWRGKRDGGGYGVLNGHHVHRLSYALFVSDFPNSDAVFHRCNNPPCYNPSHLYIADKTHPSHEHRRVHRSLSVYDFLRGSPPDLALALRAELLIGPLATLENRIFEVFRAVLAFHFGRAREAHPEHEEIFKKIFDEIVKNHDGGKL